MIGQRTRTRPRKDGTRFSSGFYLDVESYIAERSLTDMHAFQQWDDFLLGLSRLKHYFHYESYIDKPRPWWHWVRNDGTHFFAGHLDTQTESRVQLDRKGESSFRRTLIVRPNSNNTSKKDWNCVRLRRVEHLLPQYPTLSDIIRLSLSNSYHTKP